MTTGISLTAAMLLASAVMPVPEGARPATLDEELSINAIPTHVREWTLDQTMEECQAFYRHYLGERRVELQREHGLLLAARVGDGFTTIELLRSEAGGTRVRVSEARLASGDAPRIRAPIPLPPHTQILSHVSSGSGADASQSLVARTGSSLPAIVEFYEQTLARQGFRMMQRRSLQRAPTISEALSFSAAGRHLDLVLTFEDGHTWIAAMLGGQTP